MKANQPTTLERACATVNKRTPPARVKYLLRKVDQQRGERWAVIGYYLRLGTVPRTLWENWS